MGRSAAGKFASVIAIAAFALIGKPPAADAQGFPSKPVRIIVPYTPGSSWRGCWRSNCKASLARLS
jgi:tripartite-type tricarboxylate transporter receptor subunit TctC